MTGAVFRTMLLGLVRDRGALVMSFVLPALFFLIFAEIFAGASGQEFRIRVAFADEVDSDDSRRLLAALAGDPSIVQVGEVFVDADAVRDLVRRGGADTGLVVRRDGDALDSVGGFERAPLLILADPVRAVASSLLAGRVERAYTSGLPDVALRGVVEILDGTFVRLDASQRRQLDDNLSALRGSSLQDLGLANLTRVENVAGAARGHNHVAYYAGAVAVLFLLFSSAQGAISMIEERGSGILDRVATGPGGSKVVVQGKFLFLVAQGVVQVGVIFIVAWIVYGVDLPGHLGPWVVTTVTASAAAAGLAMTLATACTSRRQAQTVANVVILIISALGGSMVPRFLMPAMLQQLGWLTPNTWALEAYVRIFWRDETVAALWLPWILLSVTAWAGWLASRGLARRRELA